MVQSVYKAIVIDNWILQDISRLYAVFLNKKIIKFTKRHAVFVLHERKLVLASQHSHKQTDFKICYCDEVCLPNSCKKETIQIEGRDD